MPDKSDNKSKKNSAGDILHKAADILSQATLRGMMNDPITGAVAQASGWAEDKNGNIVQTPEAADSEGARQLRENLAQLSTIPLNDMAFATAGFGLSEGVRAALDNLRYAHEANPAKAWRDYNWLRKNIDRVKKVKPARKYLESPSRSITDEMKNVDYDAVRHSVYDYQKARDAAMFGTPRNYVSNIPEGIDVNTGDVIPARPLYKRVLDIPIVPATREEVIFNRTGLIPSNTGFGSATAMNNGQRIALFKEGIDQSNVGHELRHSVQRDFGKERQLDNVFGFDSHGNVFRDYGTAPVNPRPTYMNESLNDVSDILARRNPFNTWNQSLDELDAEIERAQQMYHPGESWKELWDNGDPRLDKTLDFLRKRFHLRDNDEANYIMKTMYENGYADGGKLSRNTEKINSLLRNHSREALLAGIQRQKEKRRRRAEEEAEAIEFSEGGKIHIKKANRGKFTESAKRAGMGVQEYARHVLANRDRYSSTLVRRANFARNAARWHPDGGLLGKAGDVAADLANAGLLGTPGIAAFWAGRAFSHGRDKDNEKETVGQRIERRIREDNEAYRNRMNDVFTGIETTGGRAYSPDFITYADSYLQRAGLNRNQRSAVIANIIEESGGDPYAKSPDGKFYGLLQWAGDRYPSSSDRPRDWGRTIDSQLDYLVGSLGNLDDGKSWTHGGSGTGYNSRADAYADWISDDPDRVMRGYTLGYVRPTGKLGSLANRAKVQRQLLDNNKFGGGGPLDR